MAGICRDNLSKFLKKKKKQRRKEGKKRKVVNSFNIKSGILVRAEQVWMGIEPERRGYKSIGLK